LGNAPAQPRSVTPPPQKKIHLQVLENYQNLVKSLSCFKKSEKEFDKLTLGDSEFVECNI
jgi:hypothetical protein